jgi:hypothetical protein
VFADMDVLLNVLVTKRLKCSTCADVVEVVIQEREFCDVPIVSVIVRFVLAESPLLSTVNEDCSDVGKPVALLAVA